MLIAEARKQKNMTQKDLAAALHVSDRAVSKWERGAGFPDVSLLEPLADALGLQVLELLRGEEQEMPEMTVRHAVSLLVRQARERTRRRWGEIFGSVLLLAMTGFVLFGILDYSGAFLRPMSLTVTAAVYTQRVSLRERPPSQWRGSGRFLETRASWAASLSRPWRAPAGRV